MNKFDTKTNQVKEHLIKKGSITSWEAIQKYKATRLSAIIFILRKKGFIIEDEWCINIDRHGRVTRYVKYHLISEADYFEKNMNHIPRID